MGTRGPAPKPNSLRALSGTMGKSKLKNIVVKLNTVEMPEPPSHLSEDARAAWDAAIEMLKPWGILASVDYAVLGAYCTSYALWKQAEELLQTSGLTLETSNGNTIVNPLVAISRRAGKDMVTYGAQLGMTPAARLRLNAEVTEKKENPFDEISEMGRIDDENFRNKTGPYKHRK